MFEMLISPREAEKKPERLFFVGLLYSSISILLVDLIFLRDPIFSKHAPLLLITFTTIFSIPFIHSLIRIEEIREITEGRNKTLLVSHSRAIIALLFLFLGFLVAFAFWYTVLPDKLVIANFQSQIEEFCRINNQEGLTKCLEQYGLNAKEFANLTGKVVSGMKEVWEIFFNNIYVLIFTLVFSLTFGAGAIFILAWNASIIAVAIGMLVKSSFSMLPSGLLMYLVHGIPEIAAYFVAALAGGILSTAVIRRDFAHGRLQNILSDFVILTLISLIILLSAALIEVYISPLVS